MWLIGAMVCLLAAPWVQLSVSAGNGWPHNVLRHDWLMPVSCHLRDCKALLVTSLTQVSGVIASVQTFIYKLSGHYTDICWFLPHDATHNRALCRHAVSVHPSGCLSRSCILSKRVNDFRPISGYISEMNLDRAIVTMDGE